jgi:hypothetical protein
MEKCKVQAVQQTPRERLLGSIKVMGKDNLPERGRAKKTHTHK